MPLPSETTYPTPEDRLRAALDLQQQPTDPDRVVAVHEEIGKAEALLRDCYRDRNDAVVQSIIERIHLDHEHDRDVRQARANAHAALAAVKRDLQLLNLAVQHLGPSEIYDVEMEGKEVMVANALAQAEVAMMAVTGILPAVDA